jgi:hypothetical protein
VQRDVLKLELSQDNWEKSYKAIRKLVFVNAIIHCFICDKSPTESIAFVQEVLKCTESNGAMLRSDLSTRVQTKPDLDFLNEACIQISSAHGCRAKVEYHLSQIGDELTSVTQLLKQDIQDKPFCKNAEYSALLQRLEKCHVVLTNVVKSLSNITLTSIKEGPVTINSSKEIENFFGDNHTFSKMCQASKALMTYPTLETAPESVKTTFLQMAEKVSS